MEAITTCRDCSGEGGWIQYNFRTKRNEISECQRCEGHGSIQYGADTGPLEDDRDWKYWTNR
jgi:DnaJ-class molecular chaperone